MKFEELNLDDRLMRGIVDLGFQTCTDVQAETFVHTLDGKDVAVQSQTGTGKTAAFLISIFQLWISDNRFNGLQALIVAPTRELAVQIERDAKAIGKHLPFKTGCFYGGVGYGAQEKAIAGGIDLIIGTPGRLLDFNQSRKLDFRKVGLLVIDEADRLFDMGFYPDIRRIMRRARPKEERVTMLYSATLSTNVRNIAWQFMNNPVEIEIAPEQVTVDRVDQVLYHVSKDEKFRLLLGILKKEDPGNALIFCNTKRATEIVAKKLQLNGYPCQFIMGDLPQKKRIKIIDSLKTGELRMLCATDVAARGLHVDDLDLVVNYDLPEDPEAYVHRIGRTARAGKTGRAVSLACERFVYSLEPIQDLIGNKIPTETVTTDLIVEDESIGQRLPSTHHEYVQKRGGDRRHPGSRTRSSQSRSHTHAEPRPEHRSPPRNHDARHRTKSRKPVAGSPAAGKPVAGDFAEPPGSKPAVTARSAGQTGDRGPSRDLSVEDRLEYYKKKYGEDFAASGAGTGTSGDKRRQKKSATRKRPAKPVKKPGDSSTVEKKSGPAPKRRGIRGVLSRIFSRNDS